MRRDKQDQNNSIDENDIPEDRDTTRCSKAPVPDGDFEQLFERGNEIVDMLLAFRAPATRVVPFVLRQECSGWSLAQIRALISAMTTIIVSNARLTYADAESGRLAEKFFARAAAIETDHPFKGKTKKQINQSVRSMVGTYLELCEVLQLVDRKFAMAQDVESEGESVIHVVI